MADSNRKMKSAMKFNFDDEEEEEEPNLDLSLSLSLSLTPLTSTHKPKIEPSSSSSSSSAPVGSNDPNLIPFVQLTPIARSQQQQQQLSPPQQLPRLRRRTPTSNVLSEGKHPMIPPPYPWSREFRATVHTLPDLMRMRIRFISGEVQCKRCETTMITRLNIDQRFYHVVRHVWDICNAGNSRAPAEWGTPTFPSCPSCLQENCMKPVVAAKKRNINWLFLFLGEALGVCNLEQLKYFCKHNCLHRTGSKMRLLLYTYLGICRQLDPTGRFDFPI